MKKILLTGLCMLAVLALACIPFNPGDISIGGAAVKIVLDVAPIDLGDNNDYDDDWGGGGDDWGGSGSDDWGGGGSGELGPVGTAILLGGFGGMFIIFAGIAVYSHFAAKNNKRKGYIRPAPPQTVFAAKDYTIDIASEVMKSDPDFSAYKFIAWVREVFFTLQYAWMERDAEKLRIFEKEELFQQHSMQIRQYVKNNRVNVLDRINVKQAYLHKYVRDREYEHISVFLQVRMIDYIKDERTGAVLKGSPDRDCHMQYLYTFSRKTGVKSTDGLYKTRSTDCPNCGAPTTISSSGKCQYCGSLITTGEFNWVLSDIIHIKAGTAVDNSGIIIHE